MIKEPIIVDIIGSFDMELPWVIAPNSVIKLFGGLKCMCNISLFAGIFTLSSALHF